MGWRFGEFPSSVFHLKFFLKNLQNHESDLNGVNTKRTIYETDFYMNADTVNFDVIGKRSRIQQWVNYRGEALQPPFHFSSAEEVAADEQFDFKNLPFRNSKFYLSGNIHENMSRWEEIGASDEVLYWIRNGVDVTKYFKHFKGNFKGKSYDCNEPPRIVMPNSKSCLEFKDFILSSITERLQNGSISLIGHVTECEPPHLVMPLTVEPSKPRLCHDERFLNLWIKDMPFVLDTLKDIPRVMHQECFMTSIDDKSGYDHIRLDEGSKKYFGFQFGGWYFVYNTIPFGFKASAYIYHTTGLAATGYCRSLGVSCLQYIDDRLVGELVVKGGSETGGDFNMGLAACYIICEVLTRLGYFIGLNKSMLEPCQVVKFLGMLVDTSKQTFRIPNDKKVSFRLLRESMIEKISIDIKTLQRFAGKCISLMLAVPGAKLYIREVNKAISVCTKNSRVIQMTGDLCEEIKHWRFLDEWDGFVPWRGERHLQIELSTDASLFRWGAVVEPSSET